MHFTIFPNSRHCLQSGNEEIRVGWRIAHRLPTERGLQRGWLIFQWLILFWCISVKISDTFDWKNIAELDALCYTEYGWYMRADGYWNFGPIFSSFFWIVDLLSIARAHALSFHANPYHSYERSAPETKEHASSCSLHHGASLDSFLCVLWKHSKNIHILINTFFSHPRCVRPSGHLLHCSTAATAPEPGWMRQLRRWYGRRSLLSCKVVSFFYFFCILYLVYHFGKHVG